MLLLHGQADPLVPHGQSEILHAALKDRGVDARFISVPGAGHSIAEVMDPANSGPTWDTIDAFLRHALQ
jgi:dipeptidyl aminopeptidase/acylaminoacyl peptidase